MLPQFAASITTNKTVFSSAQLRHLPNLSLYFFSVVVMRYFFVFPPAPPQPLKRLTLANPAVCRVNGPVAPTKEILEKLDDGVFVRTLQCLAAQQQKNQQPPHGKEPSLMPVPSPQQISYLNQFEGNVTWDRSRKHATELCRECATSYLNDAKPRARWVPNCDEIYYTVNRFGTFLSI